VLPLAQQEEPRGSVGLLVVQEVQTLLARREGRQGLEARQE